MVSGAIVRKTLMAAFGSNEPRRSQLMQVNISGGKVAPHCAQKGSTGSINWIAGAITAWM
jgi:hypothetical protein